jgi:hypothetical protein
MSSFFLRVQWKQKYHPKFARNQWKLTRSAIILDLHKNRNRMYSTPIIFGSTIKIGLLIQRTRVINRSVFAHITEVFYA